MGHVIGRGRYARETYPDKSSASSAAGSVVSFVLTPNAKDQSPVFGTWNGLYAAISALPAGVPYIVTMTGNFTVPLAGMPATGWDLRGIENVWRSFTPQTGLVTLTVPDGVVIDNMPLVFFGLTFAFAPTTADAINWTRTPPGTGARVFGAFFGATITNTGTHGLTTTPGLATQTFTVFASALSQLGQSPPSAPFVVGGGGTDVIIGSQFACGLGGGLPAGWVGGTGGALVYQNGIDSTLPPIPGWTGPAPTILTASDVLNLVPFTLDAMLVAGGPTYSNATTGYTPILSIPVTKKRASSKLVIMGAASGTSTALNEVFYRTALDGAKVSDGGLTPSAGLAASSWAGTATLEDVPAGAHTVTLDMRNTAAQTTSIDASVEGNSASLTVQEVP